MGINMDDVMGILKQVQIHLIVLAVMIVAGIAAMVLCTKLSKEKKFLVRAEAGVAIFLTLVIVVNLICVGPMANILDMTSGNGTITKETVDEATALCAEIADEGIVLVKNDGAALPLNSGTKLNVFGWASTNACYGGTGSGSLNGDYPIVTLLEGLENSGIQTNKELSDFYSNYKADRPVVAIGAQDWTLPEPNVNRYTEEMMSNAKSFSDTAMIVITRTGGENADLPSDMPAVVSGAWFKENGGSNYNATYDDTLNEGNDWNEGDTYLNLSNREKDLVAMVCESFDKVIVVYNGANAMELGWVNDYSQIKSVLICAPCGQSGFNALGHIITGSVNPSGKVTDTYLYDVTNTPTFNNEGNFRYTNMDDLYCLDHGEPTTASFVNYVEGIYVGYRFYETAAVEGLIDYDQTVLYPFGFGMSYTSFNQTMGPISSSNGTISFDVTVTNTGSAAGKDVVEVYYNPPYINGGIEKSTANLVAFDKTDLLEPGKSQVLTISFAEEDMASYDTYGSGCYVLDAGEYIISINSNSHTVIDSQTYTVGNKIVYDADNARNSDHSAAVNQLSFAEGDITYLSRADGFANYDQATAAPTDYAMPAEYKAVFTNNLNYDASAEDDPNAEKPVTGAKNGVQLVELRGLSYDDTKWNDLLDQMTVEDMNTLIGLAGYSTSAIESIGKISTNDSDGPAAISNLFAGLGSIGFPCETMMAATWNTDLAMAFGESIGKMADDINTSGWYAPAMNIHRSPFSGRNFEYYSEDGLLGGRISAQAIQGAEKYGVYAYIKHFALNDQEGNRNREICVWTNEQAAREIYLRSFELAVKEGGAKAVMSSFNYIGTQWAGGCSELCMNILRDEWGFCGFVETDYFAPSGYGYMSADQAVRNGTDCMLSTFDVETNTVKVLSNSGLQAMRNSCHNILYTVVNSRAYLSENLNPPMPVWRLILIVMDIVLAAFLLVVELFVIRKGYAKRKG